MNINEELTEVLRLTAQRDATLAVLREVEWGGRFTDSPVCPWCDEDDRDGHTPDCALAACLRKVEVAEKTHPCTDCGAAVEGSAEMAYCPACFAGHIRGVGVATPSGVALVAHPVRTCGTCGRRMTAVQRGIWRCDDSLCPVVYREESVPTCGLCACTEPDWLQSEVQRLQAEVERLQEEWLTAYADGIKNGFQSGAEAGQEAMRERCAARVDRAANEACACDGTLCGPDDVATHDADCLAFDLEDLAQAIRALEVSHD